VQETANPLKLKGMQVVTEEDFRRFVAEKHHVRIENVDVEIGKAARINAFGPSTEYKPEEFTVWSFPSRGDWATHSGNYRGNWSPYIPRNLITKYSKPRELVMDQMCGSGTTLVECKLLGRNGIGVDVNPEAIMVTQDRLNFDYDTLDEPRRAEMQTYAGDARNLNLIGDETVDLIATHPPYAGIISYSGKRLSDDISSLKLPAYIDALRKVAAESYRVLKNNRYCGVLIGDTRKGRHYIPISLGVLQAFLTVGFILKEDIIKIQHKTMTTRQKWRGHSYDFYKIAHEHLYVLRKPAKDEKTTGLKYSKKWW
jgi:DNA modification methylase